MKRTMKRGLTLLLALVLLLAALPVAASADGATGFPDVPEGAWYVQYLGPIMQAQALMGVNNIITGMWDDAYNGLAFHPNDPVTRGQFLKMIFEAAMSVGNGVALTGQAPENAHWAWKYYAMAAADNVLVADPYASGDGVQQMFDSTAEELDRPIFRYEMAVILNNVCRNIDKQKTVNVDHPEEHISDYEAIPDRFVEAVEQMYGKGLITGDENGFFNGWDNLTRAQAVTVIYRFLYVDTAQGAGLQDWATYGVVKGGSDGSAYLLADPGDTFAHWLNGTGNYSGKSRHYSYVGGNTTLDADARKWLYGYDSVYYVTSSSHASQLGCMETVSVPIWIVDNQGGTVYPDDPSRLPKTASTVGIVVNKAVAAEVHDIFQTIFDDPERFPIYGGWSAGGARYTDTMRHSWGCAIDVNALYNCECNTYNGYLKVTCGYGWWPLNTVWTQYAGSLNASSIYSIGKNPGDYGHSVVEAFAKYGWGWGGNGYSSGKKYDYMHFSVLTSGG